MAVDLNFLQNLKNLNFSTRRRVSNIYVGSRRSLRQGRGIEAFDHREYFPGDDFRSIDWNVYARTEKLHIRRFEEEKNLTLHVLVDSSASMDFSTGGMKKFDYAGSLAVGFGYISVLQQEKFAAALYSEHVRDIMQPRKGRTQLFRVTEIMNGAKLSGQTNLTRSVAEYCGLIKTKSFIVLISDFLEPIDSIREGIYHLGKHAKDLILIQVLDPGELNLKWSDDIKFIDMETDLTEDTYLGPVFKREYSERLNKHIFEITEICNELGVEFYTLSSDRPLLDAFLDIVK